MAWKNILSHNRVKQIINRAIQENRIASAYLFIGIEGIGKDALAIEFTKAVNCKEPIIDNGITNACGVCSSCKQMNNLAHSNLEFIFSLPSGGAGSPKSNNPLEKLPNSEINDIKQQIAVKAKDNYHIIELPRATQIRIAQIRALKQKLSLSSSASGGRRFVIISNADRMTQEASNALLKTLEEPNPNITIILTTSRADAILQTIHSRCQIVHCNPLEDEFIIQKLAEQYKIKAEDATVAAAFGQGSLTKSISYLLSDDDDLNELSLNILRTSFKKNYYRTELLKLIDDITGRDKLFSGKVLLFLLFLMRDIAIFQVGSDKIINSKSKELIAKFIKAYPNKDINYAVKEIETAITNINRNVNIKLIFITLFIKLRNIFLYGEKEL